MNLRRVYDEGVRLLFARLFPFWQFLGIHVTPNHFYQPVPDTRTLKDCLWQQVSELVGVDLGEETQLAMLSRFVAKYKAEYESFPRRPTKVAHQYFVDNRRFGSVDGEMLYCMVRHFKPSTLFEIGSGNSTLLSAQAILKNRDEGRDCELVACEPYPDKVLTAGFPGLCRVLRRQVQEIPLKEFARLGENDILFIDSSHVLKIGSDVQYEILEILPRLRQGVIVHLHDIFLPAEYPKDWVLRQCRFWTEQYLLQAFLSFNRSFQVVWASAFMHLRHPDKLEEAFSSYERAKRWPGSFWIKKIA